MCSIELVDYAIWEVYSDAARQLFHFSAYRNDALASHDHIDKPSLRETWRRLCPSSDGKASG